MTPLNQDNSFLVRTERKLAGGLGTFLIVFLTILCIIAFINCSSCSLNSANWQPMFTRQSSSNLNSTQANPLVGGKNNSDISKLTTVLNAATVRVIAKDSSGSGFFISQNTIITNRHVIENIGTSAVYIVGGAIGKTPTKANIIAESRQVEFGQPDFAVLKIDLDVPNLIPLKITNVPSVLDRVFSVGFPGQVIALDNDQIAPDPVFTSGEISVVQRSSTGSELIVHSANISRGSSGGPLVDICGRVVGVNTFVKVDKDNIDGRVLFALPSSSLKFFLIENNITFNSDDRSCANETRSGA